ncbi:FAD-dependent oxidoreductase [Plantactinospora sp. GCM10030261]|uniref:FAD-dependent oxidoreductase n=1 Tax=Plantactinospora sp. GCM10030261 TaxID=3273420 RepID=UPI003607BBF8
MPSTPLHVLVIGAGTGGLCLAHGLRRAGISVAVYERERTRSDALHGYRVGINPTGNRALRECLPPDLFDTFRATCARSPRHFNVLTGRMRRTASFALPPSDDPVNSERSVSRMTLRQVLLTGVEDVVHFDKTFTHYEQRADGVTAHFADGTSATGDVLVAADGTRSTVRRQYLPHARVEETGVISITAKAPITPETRAMLPPEVFDGISLIFGGRGRMGILHVMEFGWDERGAPKAGVGGTDADLIARWPGLLYDNTRDYLNLAVWSAADRFPADVRDRRGADLIEIALDLTRDWHPALRTIFAGSDPGSCFPVTLATSVPIEPWPTSTVTLLGDAIHTMTPGHGVGANTALRDASLLCRALTAAYSGRTPLLRALADYETEMIRYGFARVAESRGANGTSGDDPLYRPVIGRLALAGARGFFASSSRIPPLRRKFLADLSAYRGADT